MNRLARSSITADTIISITKSSDVGVFDSEKFMQREEGGKVRLTTVLQVDTTRTCICTVLDKTLI
jgi:hypothetical protein